MEYAARFAALSTEEGAAHPRHRKLVRRNGAAVIRGRQLLSDVVLSSAAEQAKYGGVVPEIASRAHTDAIGTAVERAVRRRASAKPTSTPSPSPTGRGCWARCWWGCPLPSRSRMRWGCRSSPSTTSAVTWRRRILPTPRWSRPLSPCSPAAGIPRSVHKSYTDFEIFGSTRDDAAGEAFDKAARVLGLPYPGGPNVERLAREGKRISSFPKMFRGNGYDFSYSGLKTAVINYCHNKEQKGRSVQPGGRGGVLPVRRVRRARRAGGAAPRCECGCETDRGGGRGDRQRLSAARASCARPAPRTALRARASRAAQFCTDNAAMIAAEGLVQYRTGNFADLSVNACAHIPLGKKGKQ